MSDLTAVCSHGSIRYLDMQLKGAATGVLFFFLLNANTCFSEEDLGFYTGYSRPTLHSALRSLARYELLQQLGERPVWSLTARVRQLDLFAGDLAVVEEKNFFSPSSSNTYGFGSSKLLLTTSTAPPEKNFSEPVKARLQEAGVFAAQAEELAGDPWVTAERITAWVRRLEGDSRVRSVAAVLYTNLRRHLEPPAHLQEKRPEPLVCPRCSTHPCMCEEWGIGPHPDPLPEGEGPLPEGEGDSR